MADGQTPIQYHVQPWLTWLLVIRVGISVVAKAVFVPEVGQCMSAQYIRSLVLHTFGRIEHLQRLECNGLYGVCLFNLSDKSEVFRCSYGHVRHLHSVQLLVPFRAFFQASFSSMTEHILSPLSFKQADFA